jgi:Skp family chaperone for outer membrane proteins
LKENIVRKQTLIAAGVAAVIALAAGGYYAVYGLHAPGADTSETPATAPQAGNQPTGPVPAPKILVIDRSAIMRGSKVGQDVSRQMQALANQAKAELGPRGQALQSEGIALKRELPTMAPDAKQKRIADYEAKQQAFQAEIQRKDNQLKTAVAQAQSVMEKTLGPILQQIVAQRGANLLLDKQAVTFATDSALDITADAVRQLDAKLPSYQVNTNQTPPAAPAAPAQ